MKKDSTDLGIIFFIFLFIFVMLACAGCSTTAYSNKDYIDRYVDNAMEDKNKPRKSSLIQSSTSWKTYSRTKWIGK
mgnify:FL=1